MSGTSSPSFSQAGHRRSPPRAPAPSSPHGRRRQYGSSKAETASPLLCSMRVRAALLAPDVTLSTSSAKCRHVFAASRSPPLICGRPPHPSHVLDDLAGLVRSAHRCVPSPPWSRPTLVVIGLGQAWAIVPPVRAPPAAVPSRGSSALMAAHAKRGVCGGVVPSRTEPFAPRGRDHERRSGRPQGDRIQCARRQPGQGWEA